jgi:hypothetical protein
VQHLEVVGRVIARMNEHRPLAGRQQKYNPDTWDDDIRACLRKGFTEAQLLAVADHKAAECNRSGDWTWYKPDTLYRPTVFKAKLGAAESGVMIGGQAKLPLTTEAGRAQCWKDHGAKQDHKPRPTLEEYLADD